MIIHQSFCQSRVATTFPWIFFALLLTQLTFRNKLLTFQNTGSITARMIICATTLTINKGESHLDIRSLVLQFSRRCPMSGSQNQRNWDSGNSETSKFLPKCRAGDLCVDYRNKANYHHFHLHPHHPHHPHTHIVIKTLPDSPSMSYLQDKYFFCSLLWSAPGS